MSKIFDLSWNGDSFFEKLLLIKLLEQDVANAKGVEKFFGSDNAYLVETLSNLSSTYYSVSVTAGKKIQRVFFLSEENFGTIPAVFSSFFQLLCVPFWLFLGEYCYFQSLSTSKKVLKRVGGYKNLTADQCDVRQSILRRRIFNRKKWLNEALMCISWGVSKIPPKHCYALLLIGRIDIFERKKLVQSNLNEVTSWLERAVEIAEEIQEENPHQAIRIFRHCADFRDKIGGDGKSLRKKAEKIAQKIGAKDQLLKI